MKINLCETCKKRPWCILKGIFERESCEDYEPLSVEEQMEQTKFVEAIMVGVCPKCGSKNTIDCGNEPSIQDNTIGACLDCGTHWCLECGYIFKEGEKNCPHWGFCDSCSKERGYLSIWAFIEKICPTCEHFSKEKGCQVVDIEEIKKRMIEAMKGGNTPSSKKLSFCRRKDLEEQFLCPYKEDISNCPKLQNALNLGAGGEEANICAWCKKHIRDDQPVWGLYCKSKMNLTKKEPYSIDLTLLSGQTVTASVTSEDSQAKADGIDFIFMCCSEKCARELKKELEQDKRMLDIDL